MSIINTHRLVDHKAYESAKNDGKFSWEIYQPIPQTWAKWERGLEHTKQKSEFLKQQVAAGKPWGISLDDLKGIQKPPYPLKWLE